MTGAGCADWACSGDAPLAQCLKNVVRRHLETYRGDPNRVAEDRAREVESLEAAYRERQVIELVQNGADAILAAGDTEGRIEVVLTADALYCANTGEPLSAEGLERGLLYSGLSPKRRKEIGRFGIGFKSVLAVTSHPTFLSRSVSLRFDEDRSRAEIEHFTGQSYREVPILRLAWQVDPMDIAAAYPVVDEMLGWAATIVVLPIEHSGDEWLSDSLGNDRLPREFLLFSPHVTSLVLDDRTTGCRRELEAVTEDGEVIIEEAEELTAWRLKRWTCSLSDRARQDGGERFGRSEVEVAWAAPTTLDDARADGQFWSFFPLASDAACLPGIVNTGWKLGTDRASMVEGDLNDELLAFLARSVVKCLPGMSDPRHPGRILDYLPHSPNWQGRLGRREVDGWAARRLRHHLWALAPGTELVPSVAGTWHRGQELLLWPDVVRGRQLDPVRRAWLDSLPPAARGKWVHESVLAGDRREAIARDLGAQVATVQSWVEALRDVGHPAAASAAALAVASDLLRITSKSSGASLGAAATPATAAPWFASELARAEIVLDTAGRWRAVSDPDLSTDATDPADRPHVDLADALDELQSLLGIDHDIRLRRLSELLKSPSRANAADFWRLAHLVGAEQVVEALGEPSDFRRLYVCTAAGEFQPRERVLRPGRVVNEVEEPAFTIDLRFHETDEPLLERIGVVAEPQLVNGSSSDRSLPGEYRSSYEREFRRHQASNNRQSPQAGYVGFRPRRGPRRVASHLEILRDAKEVTKARFTQVLVRDPDWNAPWLAQHTTRPDAYLSLDIPSPTCWAIREWGALPTSLGPTLAEAAVAPALERWREFLPVVVDWATELTSDLDLPDRLEDVERGRTDAIRRAVERAEHHSDSEAVAFLRAVDQAGWAPVPLGDPDPVLATSKAYVDTHRAVRERVWLCRTADLGDWVTRWGLRPMNPTVSLRGHREEYALAEYFPAILDHVPPDGEGSPRIIECDAVLLDGRGVPCARADRYVYVGRNTQTDRLRRALLEELCPDLPDWRKDQLVREDVAERNAAGLRRARAAQNNAERLVVLLGNEGLQRAAARLLEHSEDESPLEQAAGLLAVYGSSTLRELRDDLDCGFGAPTQWAGGPKTVEFVTRLGFERRFAGEPSSSLPPEEMVEGPSQLPPLHDFQRTVARQVRAALVEREAGMIDLPTGAGKTRVAIEAILDWAVERGTFPNVLWVAEREELCEQAVVQWSQLWRAKGLPETRLRVQRYWGGANPLVLDTDTPWVVVASRQQFQSRLGHGQQAAFQCAEVLVFDEAHHATASSYREIRRWRQGGPGGLPFACLGLSATPFRGGVEGSSELANLFDRSLLTGELGEQDWPSRIQWLQERGYLATVEHHQLDLGLVTLTPEEQRQFEENPNLDTGLDQVNSRLGENESRTARIVELVASMPASYRVIVFAASVPHAKRLAVLLDRMGIPTRPLWSGLATWARRDAIEEFRSGSVRVLTNYNVLAEGFDAPRTDAIVIARLVHSDLLFLQMLGRGMRGPKNQGTDRCLLWTTGERLEARFDPTGRLDVERYEWLWNARAGA